MKGRIISFTAAAGLSLAVYLMTVCPGVYWYDSGEFITACYTLGIPHYPGYPLYCLLGKLFSWVIPWGSVAFRVNLVSCFCASLTAGFIYLAMELWGIGRVIALVSALCFAFSSGVWSQSTIAEVYTLHTLFTALLFLGAVHIINLRNGARGQWNKRLVFTGLVFGLGLANHLSIALFLPAALYVILSGGRVKKIDARKTKVRAIIEGSGSIIIFGLCCLPGLMFYLYLPVRSLANPVLDWGDPETLKNFIAQVTMAPYRNTESFSLPLSRVIRRAGELGRLYVSQFSFIGIILALAGVYSLFKQNKRLAVFFLWIIGAEAFYALFLNVGSLEATLFGLPAYMAIIFLAGAGAQWSFINTKMVRIDKDRLRPLGWPGWTAMAAAAVLPAVFLGTNFPAQDKSGYSDAGNYAAEIIRHVREPAVIIALEDNTFFPLFYTHHVERKAEKTMFISKELITSGSTRKWYLKQLKSVYMSPAASNGWNEERTDLFKDFRLSGPAGACGVDEKRLCAPEKFEGMKNEEELRAKGAGGDPGEKAPAGKFSENTVVNGIIEDNIDRFRMYTTNPDVFKAEHLLPCGPVYLITARPLKVLTLENNGLGYYRELAGRINYSRARGRVDGTALRVYANLFHNAGVYYYRRRLAQEAVFSFREAVRMNPGLTIAYYNLGVLYKQLGEKGLAKEMFSQAQALDPFYVSAGDALRALSE